MTSGIVLKYRIIAVLVILIAAAPFAMAKQNESGICNSPGEVLIVKRPPPREDALLVKCDKTSGLSQAEPRPFSRAELARLYNESRGETQRDEHASKWMTTFGIAQESLQPKGTDPEIGAEILQFPQSNDLEALEALALQASLQDSGKIRAVTLGVDVPLQSFESARLRLFASLCEKSGGRFSIPNRFLEEFQLGTRKSLEGEVVCNCRGSVFSNPVDYLCEEKGDRKFRAAAGVAGKTVPAKKPTSR